LGGIRAKSAKLPGGRFPDEVAGKQEAKGNGVRAGKAGGEVRF
jgi:hypothetical protein